MNQKLRINIFDSGKIMTLSKGRYYINIIGGWLINENNFNIELICKENGKKVSVNRSEWPVQDYEFGLRSKRYREFEIDQYDDYIIYFSNQDTLELKHSNVRPFPLNLLQKSISNKSITVSINKK